MNDQFVLRSLRLQDMLRAAGYRKGDGVSNAGQTLVSRLAKQHGLKAWADTRSTEDYDALIAVVNGHLNQP